MEERSSQQGHRILLTDRQAGTVSGVLDVISFDEKLIMLSTKCGKITIKGDELHVNQLSLEKGEVAITGRVDTLAYSDAGKKQDGQSLLERLFK